MLVNIAWCIGWVIEVELRGEAETILGVAALGVIVGIEWEVRDERVLREGNRDGHRCSKEEIEDPEDSGLIRKWGRNY